MARRVRSNSPKLLQLSGIGDPSGCWGSHGIEVRTRRCRAVGENLGDHYSPRIVARAKNVEIRSTTMRAPGCGWQGSCCVGRRASQACSASVRPSCMRSASSATRMMDAPDYTVIFTPASPTRTASWAAWTTYAGMTCGAWQHAAGEHRATSASGRRTLPRMRAVDPAQLSQLPRRTGLVLLHGHPGRPRRSSHTPALAPYYDLARSCRVRTKTSDDELLAFARNSTGRAPTTCAAPAGWGRTGDRTARWWTTSCGCMGWRG